MSDGRIKRARRQSDVTQDLKAMADQLTELAIVECNPAKWFGADLRPDQMDKNVQDMRIKNKMNATGTLSIIKALHSVITQRTTGQANRLGIEPDTAGTVGTQQSDTQQAVERARLLLEKAQDKLGIKH